MRIYPSSMIIQNYDEISRQCKLSKEPIFLTKKGEGYLVVMDMETYNKKEKKLKLREQLLIDEELRIKNHIQR